jgi:hypothetical protein
MVLGYVMTVVVVAGGAHPIDVLPQHVMVRAHSAGMPVTRTKLGDVVTFGILGQAQTAYADRKLGGDASHHVRAMLTWNFI